jgi:endonuclease YncB( thermonuclease family)
MSLGYYRLIKGQLLVRERQSPDGDSMRFVADDPSLFEGLPRFSPPTEAGGIESYQLRFQAIDAPELHYGGAGQPHGLESRNGLLTWLGVDSAAWDWVVAPSGFEWRHKAAILCDVFEGHGRPIAFVLKALDADDGSDVKLTNALLCETYNYHAVETGIAYLGIYSGGLSFTTQSSLISAYKAAKAATRGIWKMDKTNRFVVETLDDIGPERGSLIYPKIFRRCVDALRWAGGEFEPGRDVDDFLADSPKENDQFVVHAIHGGQLKSRLSDVLEQVNNQIKIQVDFNTVEFVSK